jgi:hypothetical protein
MAAPTQLPLRDVHLPPAPGLWPPAPGWWLLIATALLLAAAIVCWVLWRRRRRARWAAWLQAQLDMADPPQAVAALSAALRRAARRSRPGAELLEGEAWLQFLDGRKGHDFSQGPGRLLLEGGFRREIEPAAFQALCALAQPRFLELMERRR